jgi:hypothetical protein
VTTDKIQQAIDAIDNVYADRHKLVILLGTFGVGKTKVLKQIAKQSGGVYLNLNLELSERLLKLPARATNDGVTVHRLIDEICDAFSPNRETLLVDNIELLFSPELGKTNPVDTFKRMSRQRPMIIALPAHREGSHAIYSSPDHQDYFPIPLEEYIVIEMDKE